MTEAEKQLWNRIKEKQILGLQFRRQHPINIFIADFYCHKIALVIEVDGGVHLNQDQKERDEGRDYFMKELGLKVLRFTNDEIFNDLDEVVNKIMTECTPSQEITPSPTLPQKGKGETTPTPALPQKGNGGENTTSPTLPQKGNGGENTPSPTLPQKGEWRRKHPIPNPSPDGEGSGKSPIWGI